MTPPIIHPSGTKRLTITQKQEIVGGKQRYSWESENCSAAEAVQMAYNALGAILQDLIQASTQAEMQLRSLLASLEQNVPEARTYLELMRRHAATEAHRHSS